MTLTVKGGILISVKKFKETKMLNIKGAIFDCDGTLVDSLGFWEILYTKIGETFFSGKDFKPAPADDKAMRTQSIYYLGDVLHNNYGIGENSESVSEWAKGMLQWYYREVVELKAGVRELLSHMKEQGIKMCIASASEAEDIRFILDRHGILDYFEAIVSCTSVGAGKDKPDVFFEAEKVLGTPHEATWVFEDSLLAIETSKKAGFKVAGAYDKHGFGREEAKKLSDFYVDLGESFLKLLPLI